MGYLPLYKQFAAHDKENAGWASERFGAAHLTSSTALRDGDLSRDLVVALLVRVPRTPDGGDLHAATLMMSGEGR